MSPYHRLVAPTLLADGLAKRWHYLNLIERGEELERLLATGLSRRALANALGWSEGTVRRNLKIARLPAPVRAVIATGRCSAKRVLDAERRGEPLPTIDAVTAQKAMDDRFVDRCAQLAGAWLLRHLPWTGYQEQFLIEADLRLWCSTVSNITPPHVSLAEMRRYRPRRKAPDYGPELLEYLLEWFLGWAGKVLPQKHLRDQFLPRLRTYVSAAGS